MESEWTPPQMRARLDIDAESLPVIWMPTFYMATRSCRQRHVVLCEINVSSEFPIPEQALDEIARLAMARLVSSKKARNK